MKFVRAVYVALIALPQLISSWDLWEALFHLTGQKQIIPIGDACLSTRFGKYFVSDSNGFICDPRTVNVSSECCPFEHGGRYNCSRCKLSSHCCELYESCVSCCLEPKYQNLPYVPSLATTRILSQSNCKENWKTRFKICENICRTNSRSLQSENTFRGYHNYCFGTRKAPIEKLPINSDWAGIGKAVYSKEV